MTKRLGIIAFAAAGVVASQAGQARAQSSVGVGAETTLINSTFGLFDAGALAFVYDAGSFHIDGLLTFISFEDNDLVFGVGGRAFFEVHESSRADFSLGGGLAIIHTDHDPDAQEDETDIVLEAAGKIRVYLASNVAVHTTLGLGILLADEGGDVFGLFGRLSGTLGITYFFR